MAVDMPKYDAAMRIPGAPSAQRSSIGLADTSLAQVLDAVRIGGAGSRHQIGRATGLGRAVVAQRINDLVEQGLLAQGPTGASTGGRPARQLRFVAEAGHLLVADLGATSIDVALTDLAGTIVAHRAEPADIATGPDAILGRVEALFDELLRDADARGPLSGIGIGVPGPVEFASGRPVSPPIMPGWDGHPVRDRFESRYGAPAWVDNDVNVMAVGESRFGVAQGHANVLFLKLGTGIGAGLISDGAIHRGAQGSAGDVGHIAISDDPSVICRCGNVGCLEALAGGAAIARAGEQTAREGRSLRLARALERNGCVTAVDVSRAAGHGDAAGVELLQRSGRHVGAMLAGAVNLFNPSLIVIGGGVAEAGDLLLASIRQMVYGRSLPLATRDLAIKRSTLGGTCGVLGAAAMVANELFAEEALRDWQDQGEPAEPRLEAVAGA